MNDIYNHLAYDEEGIDTVVEGIAELIIKRLTENKEGRSEIINIYGRQCHATQQAIVDKVRVAGLAIIISSGQSTKTETRTYFNTGKFSIWLTAGVCDSSELQGASRLACVLIRRTSGLTISSVVGVTDRELVNAALICLKPLDGDLYLLD